MTSLLFPLYLALSVLLVLKIKGYVPFLLSLVGFNFAFLWLYSRLLGDNWVGAIYLILFAFLLAMPASIIIKTILYLRQRSQEAPQPQGLPQPVQSEPQSYRAVLRDVLPIAGISYLVSSTIFSLLTFWQSLRMSSLANPRLVIVAEGLALSVLLTELMWRYWQARISRNPVALKDQRLLHILVIIVIAGLNMYESHPIVSHVETQKAGKSGMTAAATNPPFALPGSGSPAVLASAVYGLEEPRLNQEYAAWLQRGENNATDLAYLRLGASTVNLVHFSNLFEGGYPPHFYLDGPIALLVTPSRLIRVDLPGGTVTNQFNSSIAAPNGAWQDDIDQRQNVWINRNWAVQAKNDQENLTNTSVTVTDLQKGTTVTYPFNALMGIAGLNQNSLLMSDYRSNPTAYYSLDLPTLTLRQISQEEVENMLGGVIGIGSNFTTKTGDLSPGGIKKLQNDQYTLEIAGTSQLVGEYPIQVIRLSRR